MVLTAEGGSSCNSKAGAGEVLMTLHGSYQ